MVSAAAETPSALAAAATSALAVQPASAGGGATMASHLGWARISSWPAAICDDAISGNTKVSAAKAAEDFRDMTSSARDIPWIITLPGAAATPLSCYAL